MDLVNIFVSHTLAEGGTSVPHIERLRRNLAAFDQAMLAGPEFIAAMGQLEGDHNVAKLKGYILLLWLHCMAIRDSLLIVRERGTRMWNAPALAVHARAIQECYMGLYYFCIEKTDADERHLRELLWFRHVAYKKTQLAGKVPADQVPAGVAASVVDAEKALSTIEQMLRDSNCLKQNPVLAKKVFKSPDVIFSEDQAAIWERTGLTSGHWQQTWVYLSQAIHATPFAVSTILNFRADTEDSASTISMPVLLALRCFTKAVRHAAEVRPELKPHSTKIAKLADSFANE